MKILVLDTDSGFQQQLTAALAETFPALTAVFEIDARMALGYAVDRRPELAVIDCSVFEGSLFEYLERFAETAVPFILVSHSPDYRMIVEGMRTGARDFYVKGASPIQALLQMITRALLEGDHWRRIHAYAQQIRHRDEFVKINRAVQAGVESNVSRRKPEAARSPASLTPGNFYHFVFVAAQVGVESDAVTGGNRTSPEDLETSMLEEIAGIAGTYGGETWNRHGSIAILAFATEQPKPALLFAFEAMGLIVSSEFKLDALKRAPAFAFALSSDHIMYFRDTTASTRTPSTGRCMPCRPASFRTASARTATSSRRWTATSANTFKRTRTCRSSKAAHSTPCGRTAVPFRFNRCYQ